MRIRNPNFVHPERGKVDTLKAAVAAAINEAPEDRQHVTAAQLRAAVAALDGVPDGLLQTVLRELGHELDP